MMPEDTKGADEADVSLTESLPSDIRPSWSLRAAAAAGGGNLRSLCRTIASSISVSGRRNRSIAESANTNTNQHHHHQHWVVRRHLQDCAHFHYDPTSAPFDTLSRFEARLVRRHPAMAVRLRRQRLVGGHHEILVSNGRNNEQWMIERNLDDFKFLDGYVHECCVSRAVSRLPDLSATNRLSTAFDADKYLRRLSCMMDARFCCSSVLNWFQIDNKANRVDPLYDQSPVNIPAKAAATAIRPFRSTSPDELSLSTGTMISVIDMPPPNESIRKLFIQSSSRLSVNDEKGTVEVGYFPSECVRIIGNTSGGGALMTNLQNSPSSQFIAHRHSSAGPPMPNSAAKQQQQQQPLHQPAGGQKAKRGKLISFLRTFFSTRPSRTALKQAGIVEERVFGCDLGEHLHNIGCEVPKVVEVCCEFIERYGVVDGIYRLNGSFHNIQKLRQMFDDRQLDPEIDCSGSDNNYENDVYAVGSVLKMYFRELPNPLLTYYLYDRFINLSYSHSSSSVQCAKRRKCEDQSGFLKRIRELVNELPPPNQRTLRYLMKHLNYLATEHSWKTNMTAKNLAIVWAPNLLKPMRGPSGQGSNVADDELELIQLIAMLTEELIENCNFIFGNDRKSFDAAALQQRPTSIASVAHQISLGGTEEDGFMMALERLDAFLDTEFPRPNQSFISDLCPLMNRLSSTSSSESDKSFDDLTDDDDQSSTQNSSSYHHHHHLTTTNRQRRRQLPRCPPSSSSPPSSTSSFNRFSLATPPTSHVPLFDSVATTPTKPTVKANRIPHSHSSGEPTLSSRRHRDLLILPKSSSVQQIDQIINRHIVRRTVKDRVRILEDRLKSDNNSDPINGENTTDKASVKKLLNLFEQLKTDHR